MPGAQYPLDHDAQHQLVIDSQDASATSGDAFQ
jgi:hypothetical protein